MSEYARPMGEIACVDVALDDGLAGKFPVIYTITRDGERLTAENWDDLVRKLSALLDAAEAYAFEHEGNSSNEAAAFV